MRLRGHRPVRARGRLHQQPHGAAHRRAEGQDDPVPRLQPRRRGGQRLARRGARRRAPRAGRVEQLPQADVAQRRQVQRLHPPTRRGRGLDGRAVRAVPPVVGRVVGGQERQQGRLHAHPGGRHGDTHRAVQRARRRMVHRQEARPRGRGGGLPHQPRAGMAGGGADLRVRQGERTRPLQRHPRADPHAGGRAHQRRAAPAHRRAAGRLRRVRPVREAAGQLRGAGAGHPVRSRRAVDDPRRGARHVQPAAHRRRGRADRAAQRRGGRPRIAARHRPDDRPQRRRPPAEGGGARPRMRMRRMQGRRLRDVQGRGRRRGGARDGRHAPRVLREAAQVGAAQDRRRPDRPRRWRPQMVGLRAVEPRADRRPGGRRVEAERGGG